MNTKSCVGLLQKIHACTVCAAHLPFAPKPILSVDPRARILIAGQAPGRKVQDSGVPWQDASGDRLRDWLGLSLEQFYDPKQVALVPMGFYYPGTSKSGDRPPRPECPANWHGILLPHLRRVTLRIVIGRYAHAYHLGDSRGSVTETVADWRRYAPGVFPLPHPSPRNAIWLKKNPWFASDLLPVLQVAVRAARVA